MSTDLWIQMELQGIFHNVDIFDSPWVLCECVFVMWLPSVWLIGDGDVSRK